MSVHTPLPVAAHLEGQSYYTPTFAGYAWDSSLVHEETNAERKRRKKHERRAVREVECKRRKKYAARALEAIKDVIRNDDKHRSRRHKPLAAPLIPPEPGLDFTSFTGPNLDASQQNLWAGQPIQPVIPTTPLATTPPPTLDPLPQHVELNPHLAHQCPGHEPITYDINKGPTTITYKVNDWTSSPFGPEGFDQPATWPSMTRMNLVAVVDEPLPHYVWSITVSNPLGITCGDVFSAIWANFHQNVSNHEYYSWTSSRRKLASIAYYKRIGTDLKRPDLVPGNHDGMKRIDYMGDSVMFKGLSGMTADVSDGGWFLFVGPSK